MDYGNQNFLTVELDPDLLSTPFKIQTHWHVITGAPCCGKTTLIKLLSGKGFQTVPEVGRDYIEREKAKGKTLNEIRASRVGFARVIEKLTLEHELELHPEDDIFLDRALPDCLSFARLVGFNPNEVLPDCFRHRYASVFILDRFPVQKDAARIEDDVAAGFLDEWLVRDYRALGYPVVRVPVLPPEKRLAHVLAMLSQKGG